MDVVAVDVALAGPCDGQNRWIGIEAWEVVQTP